jgi:tRNA (adenine57-N1/adenine58-N1)-methyltransferase
MRHGDVTESAMEEAVDRIVLDLPEPWRVIPLATEALKPGGVFCSYVPTTPQISQTTEALRAAGFIDVTTTETLVRAWHVEGQSVRPDHRMVAHTGFITTGRFLGTE